jgi:hypothetical protein
MKRTITTILAAAGPRGIVTVPTQAGHIEFPSARSEGRR